MKNKNIVKVIALSTLAVSTPSVALASGVPNALTVLESKDTDALKTIEFELGSNADIVDVQDLLNTYIEIEEGESLEIIEHNVNLSAIGDYEVKYYLVDEDGTKIEDIIKVSIKEKLSDVEKSSVLTLQETRDTSKEDSTTNGTGAGATQKPEDDKQETEDKKTVTTEVKKSDKNKLTIDEYLKKAANLKDGETIEKTKTTTTSFKKGENGYQYDGTKTTIEYNVVAADGSKDARTFILIELDDTTTSTDKNNTNNSGNNTTSDKNNTTTNKPQTGDESLFYPVSAMIVSLGGLFALNKDKFKKKK